MNKTVFRLISTIVLFALILGSYSSVGASSTTVPQMAVTTYYVSTAGNDANAGTSTAPFKTIQKCVNAAALGSECSVAAGTYNERLNINKAITVTCAVLKSCIIKGAALATGANITGFYSINNDSSEGGIVGSGSNKIISNKVEGSCMVGIKVSGSNSLVDGNEITKSRQCSGSSGPDADGIRFFGSTHIIRNNYIHDIDFVNSPTAHIDCFQTWGGASNIVIQFNVCDNYFAHVGGNEGTQGANLEDCDGCKFDHNYIYVYGKSILWETSSRNGKAEYNILVSGLKIEGTLSGQYGLFGSASANYNLFWNFKNNGSEALVAGASGTGNLINVDPKLDGFCSIAYPSKGLPCGAPAATITPNTATATPVPASFTPTTIPASPTSTASSIPASATLTAFSIPPSATPTASSVPVSATPTASFIPASATPTASSIPASSTPIASMVPASLTPVASSTPMPPTLTPLLPTETAQSVLPIATAGSNQPISGTVYDDKNGSFVYSSDWKDVVQKKASGGSYKQTSKNGSFVTFTFTGESFSVIYAGGPAFRKIDVYVDGLLVGTINEKGKAVFQKRWDYPGKLALGNHTLKLVFVTSNKHGNTNGSLDAVIVR